MIHLANWNQMLSEDFSKWQPAVSSQKASMFPATVTVMSGDVINTCGQEMSSESSLVSFGKWITT